MRILVIEDQEEIAIFIKKGLEAEMFTVDVALTGKQGEFLASINNYDLVISDLNLPDKNGIEIIKSIRKKGKFFPVIMLSGITDNKIKIEALDSGIDDYQTKPFSMEELTARVRSNIRRANGETSPASLVYKDIIVDLKAHEVKRGEKEIKLRKKEFELLEYFVRNPKTTLSRSMILEHVWDHHADPFTNTVEVHIRALRKKINGPKEDLIKTIHGIGYKLD